MQTPAFQFAAFGVLITSFWLVQKWISRWRKENRLHQAIFAHNPNAIFVMAPLDDGGFRFEALNPSAEQALSPNGVPLRGQRLEELAGQSHYDLEDLATRLTRAAETGLPEKYRGGKTSGSEISLFPITGGKDHRHILCYLRNVPTGKESEPNWRETAGKLRALLIRRESRREREYQRIATEMHEDLGQLLTTIRLHVSGIRTRIKDAHTLNDSVQTINDLLDHSLRAVREIVTDLSPIILRHGLAVALEWLVADFCEHSGKQCQLQIDEDDAPAISQEVTTLVFRIAQEILSHIAQHADIANIIVTWTSHHDGHCLTLRHDGKNAFQADPLCLFGMQERVAALGGEMQVFATTRPGCTIETRLPIDAVAKHAIH